VGCQEKKSISRNAASKRNNSADMCILLKAVFLDPFCCTFGSSPRSDTLVKSIKIGSRSNRLPYRDESNIHDRKSRPQTDTRSPFYLLSVFLLFRIVEHILHDSIRDKQGRVGKSTRETSQSNKYHTALGVAKPTQSGSILRSCNRQAYMCNLHTVYPGFFGRISDMPRQRKKIETWLRYSHTTRCVHCGGTRVGNKAKSRLVLSKFYTDIYRRDVLYMPTGNKHSIAKRVRGRKRGKNVTRNPILESTIPPIYP
jgi:hypothetical protein